ncbi:thioredoxin domain-containing protein [Bythopirellula polymerisocia]|uniref:Thioredoxin 2 n=1 Tax=Bythopirellula polymerisocia TaxID=2528003 RepID=A0A5C6CJN8_9BACT|nr:thioredoxin domain-containing protein [Bythopirellula polymerisocia]TWU24572.1 thioredoxin 2 [Bythopirellula polymerisocia]
MTNKKLITCTFLSLLVGTTLSPLAFGTEAVRWRDNLDAAKIESIESGKLVLLHFYTTTCGPCRMLDESVFSQPQIAESLEKNYIPVKINAEEARALASAYQIERVPSEVVMTPQGNVVAKLSCPQNGPDYIGQLSNLADHYRVYQSREGAPSQSPVQSAYAGLQVGQYQQQNKYAQDTNQPGPQAGSPATTNNPYAAQPSKTVAAATPVASNAYAPPANNQNSDVALPANAMPNSYQSQSASAPAQVPLNRQPNVANSAVAQSSPTAATSTTPTHVMNPAASQVAKASHISLRPELPAGSPPLAFDGYCPVTLRSAHKWVAGDPKFGAIHRGRTFLFTSDEQRQQFFSNPDAYCPVFSGMDPVMLLESNQIVEGSRRFGFEYRGAFYLFASQESMERFKSQPDQFAAGVKQAMNRMTNSTSDTVLR